MPNWTWSRFEQKSSGRLKENWSDQLRVQILYLIMIVMILVIIYRHYRT